MKWNCSYTIVFAGVPTVFTGSISCLDAEDKREARVRTHRKAMEHLRTHADAADIEFQRIDVEPDHVDDDAGEPELLRVEPTRWATPTEGRGAPQSRESRWLSFVSSRVVDPLSESGRGSKAGRRSEPQQPQLGSDSLRV